MLVVIESPYAGNEAAIGRNLRYARACMADSLMRGEYPIASHLLYTQPGILDDNKPDERALGILAGHKWAEKADMIAFYVNLGMSPGMRAAWEKFNQEKRWIAERRIPGDW